MNNDYDKELKNLLWVIKSCAIDYDKREEGMHTFEWSELWVINDYIEELQQKVNQLETNRDEAIEYIKHSWRLKFDQIYDVSKDLRGWEAQELLSLLERGKEC